MAEQREPPTFTWTPEELRRVGHQVVDLVADHLSRLPTSPAFTPVPPAVSAELRAEPLPVHGHSVDEILDLFRRDIEPFPFGNGHPRFYAWVNPPPAPIGIFASLLAAAMNPSVAGGNHAAVHLEHQVHAWLLSLLGFSADSRGMLVSGTSAAALVALTVARHVACARHGWDVRARGLLARDGSMPPRLVVYKSVEGHSCHQKAIEVLGIGCDGLRSVPVDAALRIDAAALDAMIAADVADGLTPMAVLASAGTVNTGAIDPLDAIADVCAKHDVWLHVDGAYGAPAILVDAYRDRLSALRRADSVAVDPHKWLYVPVDAGFVAVKDGEAMRDTFSLVPPYLRSDGNEHGVQGPPWFSEFGLEQTRPFRALKVWMALRYFGVDGYRALIGHDIALAHHLAERVRATPALELWEPAGLSIVCFRVRRPGLSADALDELNRAVLERVQLGGEAFVSSTILGGRFWLRACIVNPRAAESDIDMLVDAVVRASTNL